MRRRLLTYTILFSLLVLLLPGLTRANGTTPTISVVASSTQVATGQTFDLTVQITGASNVYGTSVDLTFDPTLLEYVEGSAQGLVANGLNSNQYYATILNRSFESPARLSVIAIRLGRTIGGASGAGNLASFKFKTLKQGQATFTVNGTSLDIQMVDPNNNSISSSVASGVTVQIGPPPSPPEIVEPVQGAFIAAQIFQVSGTAPPSSALIPAINGADQPTVTTGANGLFSFPINVGVDGTHTISVREVAAPNFVSLRVYTVDTTLPFLGPISATQFGQSTISGTVTEIHLDKLFVQVNPAGAPIESDAVTVQSNGSYSVARALNFGLNTVKVTAVDLAGNVAVKTTEVDVPDISKPTIKMVSSSSSVAVDDLFTVEIWVDNPYGLLEAVLHISYPVQTLQVVDAIAGTAGVQNQPGPLLDQVSANTVNTTTGSITYWAASSQPVDTPGLLVSLQFKALATGSAGISFVSTEVRNAVGTEAPHFSESATVNVVTGGTVTGQVSLAGRGANSRSGATVKVLGHPISTVTAADGSFALHGVPAGAQQLLIRYPNPNSATPAYSIYLAQLVNINVTNGGTTLVPLVAMRGGDANGDNIVGLSDLVILARNYGLDQSSPGYDPRADFNGDNVVGLSDLVILAGSYGFEGAQTPTGE